MDIQKRAFLHKVCPSSYSKSHSAKRPNMENLIIRETPPPGVELQVFHIIFRVMRSII